MKHNQLTMAIVSLAVISILAGCGPIQMPTSTQRTGASNETINVTTASNKAKNFGATNITMPSQTNSSSHQVASPSLTSIYMTSSKIGWGTGRNTLWYTTNEGAGWKEVTPNGLKTSANLQIKLYGLGDKQAWAAVSDPSTVNNPVLIYHTSNAGSSWTRQNMNDDGEPMSLHFRDQSHGWVALMQGAAAGSERETIYQTSNGGSMWTRVSTTNDVKGGSLPFGGDKTGVSFIDSKHAFAAGFSPVNGHVYLFQSKNDGQTWAPLNLSVPSQLKNQEFTSYPPLFFDHNNGILPVQSNAGFIAYRTTDGGDKWTPTTALDSSNDQVMEWDFVSMNNGFATDGHQLFVTTDGGRAWSTIKTNVQLKNITELDFSSAADGWALTSGSLYHTTDGGHSWKKIG